MLNYLSDELRDLQAKLDEACKSNDVYEINHAINDIEKFTRACREQINHEMYKVEITAPDY